MLLLIMIDKYPRCFPLYGAFVLIVSNFLTAAAAGIQQCKDCRGLWRVSSTDCQELSTMSENSQLNLRIPEGIVPVHYDLLIDPDLDLGTFKGKVTITVNITNNASYIPVHMKDLDISETSLTDNKEISIPISQWYCEKNQFLVLKSFEENGIVPGIYNVTLHFSGRLTGKIVGFYKSLYSDENGFRSIATTKFEPVDARQAFPCFDEPALKAKFSIKIVRPKNQYSSLSNMNILKEEPGPGKDKVTVHFAETVPMSTYLVCFIVNDFKDSGAATIQNKGKPFPLKVYSTPGQVSHTEFAKTVGAEVTKYYIEYFDIAYPLPKLDLIAIPDFVSGAMENWGLITFRETALLFNETKNSMANKMRVAVVVAHEISHQWFGNLVTMAWWDDLWLNEGFASFMQYKGVDQGMPSCKGWQILDHAIFDQIHPVLKKDSALSSHPIIQPVHNPNQINEIFDTISYNKGHAVIKMLEAFMGEENFKKGIRDYLKAYPYSATTTPDLWFHLNKVMNSAEINVGQVMDTWTRQMGYPVVTVEKTSDGWVLTQSRFLEDANAQFNSSESPYGYKWDIPIHYISDKKTPKLTWLKRNDSSVKIPRASTENFIKLNHQQLGFYRVNYDKDTWSTFENMLMQNHEQLDRRDRANLIDDGFALAEAGKISYSVAMGMTLYLKKEKEYLPWATGVQVLSSVSEMMRNSAEYGRFRKYLRDLVSGFYGPKDTKYGLNVDEKDDNSLRELRVKILTLACQAGLPSCIKDVKSKFLAWIEKPDTVIHPDIRSIVLKYGMKYSTTEEIWDTVWDRYLKETNPQEKINLLQCLASCSEPWILNRFIKYAENETYIRSQDYFQVLGYISDNPVGNSLVWNYYRNEWLKLVQRFTLYHRTLGTFISTVSRTFATDVQLEEIKAFFVKYPNAGAGANARKFALERIQNNIYWLKTYEKIITQWVANVNRF